MGFDFIIRRVGDEVGGINGNIVVMVLGSGKDRCV